MPPRKKAVVVSNDMALPTGTEPVTGDSDGDGYVSAVSDVAGKTEKEEHVLFRNIRSVQFHPLSDELMLTDHLDTCELLCEESSVSIQLLSTKLQIIRTLSQHVELHALALSLSRSSWEDLRSGIEECYADVTTIRSSLESRIAELKFDDRHPMQFIHHVRRLYQQLTSDIDVRWFYDQVWSHVPGHLLKSVIKEARGVNPRIDWRCHKFDWLLRELVEAINQSAALNQIKSLRKNTDRIARIQNGDGERSGNSKNPSEKKKSGWLSTWAAEFKVAVSINGPKSDKIKRVLVEAADWRRLVKPDKHEYFVVVFNSANEAESALEGISYRPFPGSKN